MKYSILILVIVGAGCGFNDVDPPDDASDKTIQPALTWGAGAVSVEYRPNVSESAMVHAQFLLASNLDRDTAFNALEIWSPDRELDEDACSIAVVKNTPSDSPTLRLLSVNEISIETATDLYRLEERRLPDAVSEISGVVYGNDQGFEHDTIEVPFEPGGNYVIRAQGSEELSGFEVELIAPEPVLIESVSGSPLDENREVFLNDGEDLTITWIADETTSELFFQMKGSQVMTCRLANDGEFTIPIRLVQTVGSSIEATLRTIESQTIVVDGLGPTQFIIGTADAVQIHVN